MQTIYTPPSPLDVNICKFAFWEPRTFTIICNHLHAIIKSQHPTVLFLVFWPIADSIGCCRFPRALTQCSIGCLQSREQTESITPSVSTMFDEGLKVSLTAVQVCPFPVDCFCCDSDTFCIPTSWPAHQHHIGVGAPRKVPAAPAYSLVCICLHIHACTINTVVCK